MAGNITTLPRTERFALTTNEMLRINIPRSTRRVSVKVTSDAGGATLVAGYVSTNGQTDANAVVAAQAIALLATEWPWSHELAWDAHAPASTTVIYVGTSTGAGGYAFLDCE